jgi:hypothetical protein
MQKAPGQLMSRGSIASAPAFFGEHWRQYTKFAGRTNYLCAASALATLIGAMLRLG